jgi:hypothetical protein
MSQTVCRLAIMFCEKREGFELVGGRGRRNAPVEEATRNRGFREHSPALLFQK